jgi:hypothetical protein
MDDAREAFLEAAAYSAELLSRPEVATRWTNPSVLAEFSVAGLAGHLLRGLKTVESYLDQPEPDGEPISAAAYFHALAPPADIDAPTNRTIRERGDEAAAAGPLEVAVEAARLTARLADRLETEPGSRKLLVGGDLVLRVDDYLRTRIVELVIHSDDLAASVGEGTTADSPSTATSIAIETVVGTARLRHGDMAVLRALARRERDTVEALRVF